ncbi:MAG: 2-dehydropantoate 2-reductase [Betaproteobacteria bacterium]|nr:MAG: 2-dehydropantoate 2-reductase [Betaproteobacteria bacterium]
MKICIFGAGAIGGYVGVQLARGGAEVSVVARGDHLAAIRARGLKLEIDGDERIAHLPCTDRAEELGEQDYVIIALKAHQITDAAQSIASLLGHTTTLVTASNGLPYWFLQCVPRLENRFLSSVDPDGTQLSLFGSARAIGCVVYPAAEVVAPGVVRHEHGRKFPIGEPDGTRSDRLERFHEAMEAAGLDAPVRDDIRDEIWLKLWGNLCFNPVSALTCATTDVIASNPGTRSVCRAMMMEAAAIGERLGLRLRVDVDRRIDGLGSLGAHKMSMLQDLEHRRSMEIESLVGAVAELGRLTGVPTPTVDVVLALVRQRALSAGLSFATGSINRP